MAAVRIVIADDHELVRRGARALLESQPGWKVVGEASTGRQALEQVKTLKPDVVLMDISMPELNGLEATRQILKVVPRTQVLILTLHESEQVMRSVLEAGARGYILKSDAERKLLEAVEAVHQGRAFFTSKAATMVLEGYLRRGKLADADELLVCHLTARERQIVQLLAEGKSNKEVASMLGISVHTAETHRSNIMHKLDLHSLSDLTRYAIRNGIVNP